ncbi:BTAD domain-containing putative transcriptional regulator [Sphaerisporangium sp. NPDC049003]|uniref:BTAD domain-containing putative transcriptional regulator n=1 Tax=Sphaerisporangium sp. NPDC049003 TaxID=3364517 RepID=UPI0037218D52
MVLFRVLGTFEVLGDSGPVELGGPRPRSVLARLLVARRQVVPVERIIDDLWRDQPPPSALASIQAYVSNLRRALEPGRSTRSPARLLVTVPPGYVLRAEDVDAWRFEARARQGIELLRSGDAQAASRVLDEAVRLGQGSAYPEFSSAEWAMTEISRLEELHAFAVEQRAASLITLGDAAQVVPDLQGYVGAHPLREEGWRLLALALYHVGRQGDALATLRQARRTLAEELGVDPGPALQRMEADVLAQSPRLDVPTPPPISRPVPIIVSGDPHGSPASPVTAADDPPAHRPDAEPVTDVDAGHAHGAEAGHAHGAEADRLHGREDRRLYDMRADRLYGREAEMAALLRAAEEARSGRVRPAVVIGEAGMGKSALADGLARELLDADWQVAVGRCPETDGAPPGWAWTEILRGLMERFPAEAALATALGPLADEGGVQVPGASGEGGGESISRGASDDRPAGRGGAVSAGEGVVAGGGSVGTSAGGAPGGWSAPAAPGIPGGAADAGGAMVRGGVTVNSKGFERNVSSGRFRARRALAAYLRHVARAAPLLIVLDDLHRADDETLAVLTHLVTDLRGDRVLLVLTYREEEGAARLTETAAALAAREPVRVALHGLDGAATGDLLRSLSGGEVSAGAVAAVADRTGGNPFFVRETARLIASEGERAAVSVVPAGVRDVLRRRFVRLPVPAQTVMREAAVIGRDIDVDVLAEVNGGGEEAVVDALEAALMAGLLVEPEPGRLRFAHALVRDTFYDDISGLRRTRTHARVAAALEALRSDEVAALAHHFAAGGERVKAAHYAVLAAERAERRFAYSEAAALWDRALHLGDGEDLELLMRRVRALALANELSAAREHREQAVRLALPLGDPELTARVIVAFDVPALWSIREYGVVSHEIVQVVEHTLAELGPGDGHARCALLCSLATELGGEATTRGEQAAGEALAMARRLCDPGLLAKALNARYFHTFRGDGLAERREIGTELLELAQAHGMAVAEVLARLILMQQAIASYDWVRADEEASAVERLAARYDLPMQASLAGFYRAFRYAIAEDYGKAEELYREAARAHSKAGAWRFEIGLSFMARYCLHLLDDTVGELAAEADLIAGHWEMAREPHALALVRAGRPDEADAVLGDDLSRVRPDFFGRFFVVVRGLLGVAIDDRRRVLWAREALLPYARRPVTDGSAVISLWPVAQVLGDIDLYLGRPEEAREHYRAALEISTAVGAPAWVRAAREGLARCAARG